MKQLAHLGALQGDTPNYDIEHFYRDIEIIPKLVKKVKIKTIGVINVKIRSDLEDELFGYYGLGGKKHD